MAEPHAIPVEPQPAADGHSGGAYVYVIAFIAAAGGFNFGFDLVLMSGAILYMEQYFNLSLADTPLAYGFTMTSGKYGALVGVLIGSRVADWVGRKRTLILAAIVLLIGTVGTVVTDSLPIWNVCRILGGVGAGLAALVSPLYISEIAPARKRGMLVTFNQLAIVLGAFLANVAAYVIAKHYDGAPDCWRWMFAAAGPPVVVFLVGLFFVPRSPRWLVMTNQTAEARAVLTRIGGRAHADEELQDIATSLRQETGSFAELFQAGTRIALVIAVGLALFQQLGGVSTLVNYAPTVFRNAGIAKPDEAIRQTVILRVWDLGWTLFAIFYVEKLGRRPLLLIGILGMALGQLLMGLNFYSAQPPYVTLIVFFVCLAAYDVSLAPLGWLIMSEIFPTRIRARGMAVAALFMQVSGLFLDGLFPKLISEFKERFDTEAGVFWIFCGFCLAAFAFSYYLVPETKGRTLEQIAEWWSRKNKEAA